MPSKPSSSRDHVATETDPDGLDEGAKSRSDVSEHGKEDGKEIEEEGAGKGSKKPRGPQIPREFVEVNRWLLDDHDEDEIHGFILEYLAELEQVG